MMISVMSIVLLSASSAAVNNVGVTLDGSILDAAAQVNGQSVFLPVRAICEALGYGVTWLDTGSVKTVSISKDGDTVILGLTNQEVTDNGHQYAAVDFSGAGLKIISNRTYMASNLFCSIFPLSSSYDTENNLVTLQTRYENMMTVTTEKFTSDKDHFKATIQYPQISGLADDNAEKDINALMKQSAQNALYEGLKNADDMTRAIKEGYTRAVGMCETYFDYKITYNQNGLFSVVLMDYQYAGGAHGGTTQSTYTFDLATGKVLQLSDLMDSTGDFTEFIDASIRKEIDRRKAAGELSEFDFRMFKSIGVNPEYYLSNDGVVIYFQEYSYFPYAAGIQSFSLTFSDLGALCNKEFKFLCSAPVVLDPKMQNILSVGDIGQVVLNGNPSTGYTWHCSLSNGDVLSLVSENYNTSAKPGVAGAGGTYTWNFEAQKAGESKATFQYYRDWEGTQSALQTFVYEITVK